MMSGETRSLQPLPDLIGEQRTPNFLAREKPNRCLKTELTKTQNRGNKMRGGNRRERENPDENGGTWRMRGATAFPVLGAISRRQLPSDRGCHGYQHGCPDNNRGM